MQQIHSLVRRPVLVVAAMALVAGVALMVFTLMGGQTQEAPELGAELASIGLDGIGGELMPVEEPTAAVADEVIVYVSGAVAVPDVYRLPAEARVKDLVLAAGGLTPDADPDRINLAEKLADGRHVIVPRQGEVMASTAEAAQANEGDAGGLMNINSASVAELDTLPGIGQITAERIVEHREANGPFTAVEELQSVRGIGPALLAKIAPLVTIG
jgi:competence protein ComEA